MGRKALFTDRGNLDLCLLRQTACAGRSWTASPGHIPGQSRASTDLRPPHCFSLRLPFPSAHIGQAVVVGRSWKISASAFSITGPSLEWEKLLLKASPGGAITHALPALVISVPLWVEFCFLNRVLYLCHPHSMVLCKFSGLGNILHTVRFHSRLALSSMEPKLGPVCREQVPEAQVTTLWLDYHLVAAKNTVCDEWQDSFNGWIGSFDLQIQFQWKYALKQNYTEQKF